MRCISLLKPGVHLLSISPEVMSYHTASTVHTFTVSKYALHAARDESLLQQVEAEEMIHLGLAALAPAYFLDQAKGLPGETKN